MSRRRHTAEQIITALREAEVGLANGKTIAMISRELGISEQTYHRWRNEFGGMKVDQARRLKELEQENGRLKRAVANLTVDKLILENGLRLAELRVDFHTAPLEEGCWQFSSDEHEELVVVDRPDSV
jgi:transposase-like protein